MSAIYGKVLNRGSAPPPFIGEMVGWCKTAPDDIFARTDTVGSRDIYNKVFAELGPYTDLLHRKAVMLEVMRVLALFESSCDWNEGVDTSKSVKNTSENAEAGAWQTSYDARKHAPILRSLLAAHGVDSGIAFQREMKKNHPMAMEFVARLMRINTEHNGPLHKGIAKRKDTWPQRPNLWEEKESIYPWLSRKAVEEFKALLTAA